MKYWDTSAIMPLLVQEQASAAMKDIFGRDKVVFVWWAAEVECVSALARVERERRLNPDDLAFAYRRLEVFCASWYVIQPVEVLKEIAKRLLRVHPLSAADALQLAAAVVGSRHNPRGLEFVCLDSRLSAAAQREGFNVIGG